jgi:hypothetical protein
MNLLGKPTNPQVLIESYEAKDYFITYPGERTPSFSVNCNVLDALLHSPNPSDFTPQIEKTTRYLCKRWYESNEPIMDKWVRFVHLRLLSYADSTRVEYLFQLLNYADVQLVGEIIRDVGQGTFP